MQAQFHTPDTDPEIAAFFNVAPMEQAETAGQHDRMAEAHRIDGSLAGSCKPDASLRLHAGWPAIGSRVIAGVPYVTGLGPIQAIDAIVDLPDEMKRRLATSMAQDESENDEHFTDGRRALDRSKCHDRDEGRYGPVFSPDDVRDARRLLKRLDRSKCVDDNGRRYLNINRAPLPERDEALACLCDKLTAIGLVSTVTTSFGMTIKRLRA